MEVGMARSLGESSETWGRLIAEGAQLGDERLNQRLGKVLGTLGDHPGAGIPTAFADPHQAKAVYRFLANPKLAQGKLLAPIAAATVRSLAGQPTVYLVQDTTSVNFTDLADKTTGLGPLNDQEGVLGLHVHTTLAVRADGVVAGVVDLAVWARPPREKAASKDAARKAKAKSKRRRPIEEKESHKWLAGMTAARAALDRQWPTAADDVAAADDATADGWPRVIHVMDAEGDVFEVLAAVVAAGEGAIIRNAQDRTVAAAAPGDPTLAYAAVRQTAPIGVTSLTLQASHGRPERVAQVELRRQTVTVVGSKNFPQREPFELSLVEVFEPNPPAGAQASPKGAQEGICWRLWTTEPTATLADLLEIVRAYGLRWRIEEYHLTLKSGCRIEQLQLETADRLGRAITLLAAVAARVVTLRDLGRRQPDAPCTLVLSDPQWRTLWARWHGDWPAADQPPPTIREAMRWIGRLGGHLGRKSDGAPGVRTLWRGWQRLTFLIAGAQL